MSVVRDGLYLHFGEGRDGLISGRELTVALVLEVTECTRKGKGTVNAAIFDEAARARDTGQLSGHLGLVVDRHVNGASGAGEHSAGVTCVGANNFSLGDKNDGSGTSSKAFATEI